jgi:hypothetical protein
VRFRLAPRAVEPMLQIPLMWRPRAVSFHGITAQSGMKKVHFSCNNSGLVLSNIGEGKCQGQIGAKDLV